jgi:predicted ATPase
MAMPLCLPLPMPTLELILCGMVGDIETGYEFGRLLWSYCHSQTPIHYKARTLTIVTIFIIHWKEHTRELLKPLLEGYQSGLETGDLEFAAYCAHGLLLPLFYLRQGTCGG